MLNALRTCLLQLRSYYDDIGAAQNLSLAPSHTHPRFYPYLTSFTDESNQVIHFEYDTALEAHASVTYKATTFQNDTIVVKFVSRYNADVHNVLAAKGHGPKLRYCGSFTEIAKQLPKPLLKQLPAPMSVGPMQIVVMDYVNMCEQTPADVRE